MDAAVLNSWPHQKFEFAVAMDVFEHIEDDFSAIRNLHSHLSEGAQIFITVPSFQFLWSSHDIHNQHFRRYSMKQLIDLLESNGFKIDNKRYWNSILIFPIWLARKWNDKVSKKTAPSEYELKKPSKLTTFILSNIYWVEFKFGAILGKLPGFSIIVQASKRN